MIAVPPVKGRALCLDNNVGLWSPLFKIAELKTIVRVKDVFAELLSQLRAHSEGEPWLERDIEFLKFSETGEVSSA